MQQPPRGETWVGSTSDLSKAEFKSGYLGNAKGSSMVGCGDKGYPDIKSGESTKKIEMAEKLESWKKSTGIVNSSVVACARELSEFGEAPPQAPPPPTPPPPSPSTHPSIHPLTYPPTYSPTLLYSTSTTINSPPFSSC
ncbi:hypothetical protein HZH68_008311 [Vespula germanica]|uniref:Uncharacterized protein n=1 Tax=Vespula germanica TaxID=30212 RepID=A0A834K7F7_VESGE|nr:hypothetical protein HZH68_008311 [Vespula germanica]